MLFRLEKKDLKSGETQNFHTSTNHVIFEILRSVNFLNYGPDTKNHMHC